MVIDLLDDPDDHFLVRVQRFDGSIFEADLGTGYDSQTRMENFGCGIVVRHPNKPPVYINGTTSQVSKNPEICRSHLILVPDTEDIGRIKRAAPMHRGLH